MLSISIKDIIISFITHESISHFNNECMHTLCVYILTISVILSGYEILWIKNPKTLSIQAFELRMFFLPYRFLFMLLILNMQYIIYVNDKYNTCTQWNEKCTHCYYSFELIYIQCVSESEWWTTTAAAKNKIKIKIKWMKEEIFKII